ncbi:MAG: translation initiation factor IF-2 [Alphaproteobacteria bacterium]|nr:translation initiation factor IF-2 [Alphaproteobacteria bacterium]
MTESNDDKKEKPSRLSRPGTLELKKTVETGQVRQSFSHGRSRAVTVEVKRKRVYAEDQGGTMSEVRQEQEAPQEAGTTTNGRLRGATGLGRLTEEEKATRSRALQDAMQEDVVRQAEEVFAPKTSEESEPSQEEGEAAEAQSGEEAQPEASPESAPGPETPREEEKASPSPEEIIPEAPPSEAVADHKGKHKEKPQDRAKRDQEAPRKTGRRSQSRRREGKLTISQALEDDGGQRVRSLAAVRRAREKEKEKQRAKSASADPTQKFIREVVVPDHIIVSDLANRMAERANDVIKVLMKMDVMATINEPIDGDTAELVVAEFGHKVRRVSDADVEIGIKGEEDTEENLQPRPPVVTVMGHVDHGKTSLLDALRETDIAAGETGGITQHIGAYQVALKSGAQITFLDTPGHEAFTDMRARGANVTDIVILVVAADDGIMDQTLEAINHATAAEVPVIIAINKIDAPGADPNRVRTELLQHGVVVEEMGGEVLAIEVSAKEKTNLDKLEETILLQAELLELKANPDRTAEGAVVEARVEKGRGPVATVLVERGTLHVGDIFVAGAEWGKVRALVDDKGKRIKNAGPAAPVEVLGLSGAPMAGDHFAVVESEARAREVVEYRTRQTRLVSAADDSRGSIEEMLAERAEGEVQEVPVIIKGDVQGSVEAIAANLNKLATDEVKVRVLHSGVAGINESDVTLAHASNALIIGFNVRANPQARDLARRDHVDIRYYSIIYNVIDDIKAMMSGMLSPTLKENFLGNIEIREVFSISKVGKVAGCMVIEGMAKRGAKVRLLRDHVVIHEGDLSSLQRFKDEVKEVKEGTECGLALANYQDIQVGDVIECFETEEIARAI